MGQKMSLGEYGNELRSRTEKFMEYWRGESKRPPEIFPEEMESGDWDEQFRAWEETPEIRGAE